MKYRNVDIEGFFPTPDAVIDMMLAAADLYDGQTVLEPSAGIGSICDRVKQAFPHTDLDAVELRDSLAKISAPAIRCPPRSRCRSSAKNPSQASRRLITPVA